MADYSRDQDIGATRKETHNVEVQNFAAVISAIEAVEHSLQEAVAELEKIRTGTGLILGEEIEEAE